VTEWTSLSKRTLNTNDSLAESQKNILRPHRIKYELKIVFCGSHETEWRRLSGILNWNFYGISDANITRELPQSLHKSTYERGKFCLRYTEGRMWVVQLVVASFMSDRDRLLVEIFFFKSEYLEISICL
jgi:hypothetical protein